MIIETKRAAFDPIVLPLTEVGAGATKQGAVIDFDAENQMVETNEVLEIYIAEKATAEQTVTTAVEKEVTLEVTTAPTSSGNITVAGVEIALDPVTETDAEATALAIASADYSGVGWTAVQGTVADVAKVFFTAVVAGVKEDLVFADPGTTTGTEATATTTEEGVAEIVTPHVPTLQVKVMTSDDGENFSLVQSGEVMAHTALTEGAVVYKSALADKCKRFVRIDLSNASDDPFSGGKIVGVVRPL